MDRPSVPADLHELDLSDPDWFRGGFPHALFETLRREAPVFWHPAPEGFLGSDEGFWVLSRHADVQATNRDTDRFSAFDGPSLADTPGVSGTMLVALDGDAHTRQRRLISAGFTPRMVGRIEDRARTWAREIVDAAIEQGTCEFVGDVAYRLPMNMIADILGIPVADREWLFGLTNDFLSAGDPDTERTPEEQLAIQAQMFQYGQELGRRKRENPEDDVWTILATVELEDERGERSKLSELELDMFFLLLVIAGSETTRSAIAGGLHALLESPAQLDALRRSPDAMRPATEEILRWTSPVTYFARRATCDLEIGGTTIEKGQRVTLWYPSANRDEGVFEGPFGFDIARGSNPHVAFGGGGAHFCLGANLARREIAILFEELLGRASEIELLGPPQWRVQSLYNPVSFAMKELPVRLVPGDGGRS